MDFANRPVCFSAPAAYWPLGTPEFCSVPVAPPVVPVPVVVLPVPVPVPVAAPPSVGTVSVPDDGAMPRECSHIVGNVIPPSILPVDMEVATLMDVTGRIVKEWRHEARQATGSDWPEALYVGDVAPSYYVLRIRTGRNLTMMSIIVGR